jgi:hypothetical protein
MRHKDGTSWIEFGTTGDDNTATKKTDVKKDCVIWKKIEAHEKKMAAVKKLRMHGYCKQLRTT